MTHLKVSAANPGERDAAEGKHASQQLSTSNIAPGPENVKPFGTVIMDPPWPYAKTSRHAKLQGFADTQYSTLSIEELAEIPIGQLADYLFLWTTGPFLPAAANLVERWNFGFKTVLPWVKTTKKGEPRGTVGHWFRGCCEYIIVAKAARVPSIRTGLIGLIGPIIGHSHKPDDLHEIVEGHFPGPYLELFGRRDRPGWTVIGDEAPGDGRDIRESVQSILDGRRS